MTNQNDTRLATVQMSVEQGLSETFSPFLGVIDFDGMLSIQTVCACTIAVSEFDFVETRTERVGVLLFRVSARQHGQ